MWRPWRPWEDVPPLGKPVPVDSESTESSSGEEEMAASAKKTRRPKFDKTFQQAIFDVYHKAVRDGSSRPITDVCETLKLCRSVVSRVLHRGRPVSPKKRGRKEQFTRVDDFDEDRIRDIVYDNFRNGKEPTVQSLYVEVKEKLTYFSYSQTTFHRLLRKMNFRFKKVTRNNVTKYMWVELPVRVRRNLS